VFIGMAGNVSDWNYTHVPWYIFGCIDIVYGRVYGIGNSNRVNRVSPHCIQIKYSNRKSSVGKSGVYECLEPLDQYDASYDTIGSHIGSFGFDCSIGIFCVYVENGSSLGSISVFLGETVEGLVRNNICYIYVGERVEYRNRSDKGR